MRLLPWLLLPAISVVTALSISGIEINVLAEVGSGSIEAFELFGTSGIDLTDTTLTDAATLILQDGTGYLYVEDNEDEAFTSGYAILVVPFNVVNVAAIFLVDAAYALSLPTIYRPLVCSPQANSGLTCTVGTLTEFGECSAQGNILVGFSILQQFLTTCGAVSSTLVNSLSYRRLASYGGGIGTGAGGGTTGGGAATSSISASAQGSCSVTVMLYLASSTTYVPAGYVGSASAQGGGGIVSGLPGIGCTPVTSVLHVSATSSAPPKIS